VCATKQMNLVINHDEDTFILHGWDHNPNTRFKVWYFVHDEEQYKDKLLHCTVDLETAKRFGVNKQSKFYDPIGMPGMEVYCNNQRYCVIDTMHSRYQHTSSNEMKNMIKQIPNDWQGLANKGIKDWYNGRRRFCSGCAEGKMKEHTCKALTKPLKSDITGEITVGDIMFVEMKNKRKKNTLGTSGCVHKTNNWNTIAKHNRRRLYKGLA
jgi:hypothetical protein